MRDKPPHPRPPSPKGASGEENKLQPSPPWVRGCPAGRVRGFVTLNPQLSSLNRIMANVLDIRRRIRSVKNTQQIPRAMKMVAAAPLRRAQERVLNARLYANQILNWLSSLTARFEQRVPP